LILYRHAAPCEFLDLPLSDQLFRPAGRGGATCLQPRRRADPGRAALRARRTLRRPPRRRLSRPFDPVDPSRYVE